MIDQDILYSECPCGSGKKFKFCCYPSIRDDLPRDPTRADVTDAIRMRSRMARLMAPTDKPGVLDLDRFHELIGLGLRHLHSGRYREAESVLLQAKDEFGMLPTPYNNLALCALVQGNLKEAEKWVREVVKKFPTENPFGLAMYADIRYLKGDVVGALDVIDRAEQITLHIHKVAVFQIVVVVIHSVDQLMKARTVVVTGNAVILCGVRIA